MRGIVLTFAMLLASASVEAQEAPDTEIVTIASDRQDRLTVPVRIGEHGPFRFMIDTGSQRTVLSTELASRLSLTAFEKRRIIGLAGTQFADTVMVDELALGRRSFYDLMVLLFEAQHIGADGIVGTDSLQDQRVLIDFAANSMTVGDAKSLGGNSDFEIVVTARRRSGQLIVTNADIDGVKTALVIDTGSANSVGNRALQRALGQRGKLPQATLVSVTGQEAIVDLGFAERIGIGGITISNAVIAFADGPAFAALGLSRRPALMLGIRELRLFNRVAIDFAKRKVLFDLPTKL